MEQPGGGSQVMQHMRRLLEAAELARGGAADPEQGPPCRVFAAC